MATLPTGTVTFSFTDIEGSTQLLQCIGDRRDAKILGNIVAFSGMFSAAAARSHPLVLVPRYGQGIRF
jgi:hypothetical protein